MIVAAGKKTRDSRVEVLIVVVTPAEAERLKRGGSLKRSFADIDPALGDGVLILGGARSQEEAAREIAKRFPDTLVRNVDE